MLTNFGNSVIQTESMRTKMTATISDEFYMSPANVQIINTSETKLNVEIKPGKSSDIFAAGVIFLQLVNGGRPTDEDRGYMLWDHQTEFQNQIEAARQKFKDYPNGPALIDYLVEHVLTADRDECRLCS